jgi:hypothetical protein
MVLGVSSHGASHIRHVLFVLAVAPLGRRSIIRPLVSQLLIVFSLLFLGQCVNNSFPPSAEAHFLLSFAYPAADVTIDLERTIRKNRCTRPTAYQAIFAHHPDFLES